MKIKNKLFALVEIAIVLCSLFLVALPATTIAAEQDDYVLGIYGNANEDDTIDMRDLTYVKLIFFGKKPETELADAKYDGKINPLDFIQIKLIIVGKEKEITIVQYMGPVNDITEEPVTFSTPLKRLVVTNAYATEALCAFGEQDKIVGVTESVKGKGELKMFIGDKATVGSWPWDFEKIVELKPDIVVAWFSKYFYDFKKKLNAVGIPLVQMGFYQPLKYSREIRNLGWMLGKQERAEELIDFEQHYLNLIEERVKDLKEEQKPRVYFEAYKDYKTVGTGSSNHATIIDCGGINIFADLPTQSADIDPEAVIERNPQVIIRTMTATTLPSGYDVTDTDQMEELRNDIMNRPGWDHLAAVKNGRVYLISYDTKSTHSCIWHTYIAKWLHPELFEDIDPQDIHRDWIETFLGIEYRGVYVCPIPS